MSKKGGIPDAWDDDFAEVADKPEVKNPPPLPDPKLTKAEKKRQHQEFQKQLWDSAENTSRNHWLEAQGVVPLKQEFKPPLQVLSRKPAPTIAKRGDATTGMNNLSLEDDGDDSEEEARKKQEADMAERQRKAKEEREEKLRVYNEARERIFGTPRESSQGRDSNRRGRGGRGGSRRNSRPASKDTSPTRSPPVPGQLFDPNDVGRRMPKPTTPTQDAPTRQPKGPESSGRGGFGFAMRGGTAPA
ncbi:hypothetical protein EJ03DRAFT_349402 [Teratosphaeria nubilosa]|uniref:SUZ domain-containing protein n=1 Tax=Teratosphaeria nubilosa TaxID=161662 RepID=A0A6G1LGV6_9PEZI|nr:hypothetical protein EJ03DRAFT_349402 [Teratosphaeria nubilosa]